MKVTQHPLYPRQLELTALAWITYIFYHDVLDYARVMGASYESQTRLIRVVPRLWARYQRRVLKLNEIKSQLKLSVDAGNDSLSGFTVDYIEPDTAEFIDYIGYFVSDFPGDSARLPAGAPGHL